MTARTIVVAALALLAALATLYTALQLATVEAPRTGAASPSVQESAGGLFEVKIHVTRGNGSTTVRLGPVSFSRPTEVAFRVLVKADPDVAFRLSGALLLEGQKKYSVLMPCMAAHGFPCYRVQVVIPGYDQPVLVMPGTYNASLDVAWESSGDATLTLVIVAVNETGKPLPTQGQPEAPGNETTSPGSPPAVLPCGAGAGTDRLPEPPGMPWPVPRDGNSSCFVARLHMTQGNGSARLSLGVVNFSRPTEAVFELFASASPDVAYTLSGTVYLYGPERYVVHMPCAVSHGLPCYRVLAVIPGYDAPIVVRPGVYNVSLHLAWESAWDSTLTVALVIVTDTGKKPLTATP
ncbi:hypothetical protein IG193_00905 [Infirmifilum lucidum]|uniref:Uncharacterized protein n=1 Tax=Infirmifilum lucidum TaxID=2776706 RepID=A0A7L9FH69_9CREN|nr:hypothetical protein [Infirmifilum lucidum]QOJ79057.1 hypothetical protein IG193_00905 [Infirmifilum lucidum]